MRTEEKQTLIHRSDLEPNAPNPKAPNPKPSCCSNLQALIPKSLNIWGGGGGGGRWGFRGLGLRGLGFRGLRGLGTALKKSLATRFNLPSFAHSNPSRPLSPSLTPCLPYLKGFAAEVCLLSRRLLLVPMSRAGKPWWRWAA